MRLMIAPTPLVGVCAGLESACPGGAGQLETANDGRGDTERGAELDNVLEVTVLCMVDPERKRMPVTLLTQGEEREGIVELAGTRSWSFSFFCGVQIELEDAFDESEIERLPMVELSTGRLAALP
jgi:hypothetical protein